MGMLLDDGIEDVLGSDRQHISVPSLPLNSAPTKIPPDLVSQGSGRQSKQLSSGRQLPHLLPASLL